MREGQPPFARGMDSPVTHILSMASVISVTQDNTESIQLSPPSTHSTRLMTDV